MNIKKTTPYTGDGNYIFISYAHKDINVYNIINQLSDAGYNIWYDEGIDPGTEWDDEIATHIDNCDSFIAFISNNYLTSDNCKDELNYARDLEKERLLIYLEDVSLPGGMAMRLNRLQAIHMYRYKDEADFYNKLYNTTMINRSKAQRISQDNFFSEIPFSTTLTSPPVRTNVTPTKSLFSPTHVTEERYILKDLISQGGPATVYKAQDTKENREVTVKFYSEKVINSFPFFSNERLFNTIMDIKNPNLSRIFDIGCIKTPYIISEYIDGQTWQDYMSRIQIFSIPSLAKALSLFRQILVGMNGLHMHGIFYGDINPYNIIVSKEENVYLIDYTEANYNGSNSPNKTIVVAKYMSPERRSFSRMDYRSDIYEAGILLKELLDQIVDNTAFFIPKLNTTYVQVLTHISKKASSYEPMDRYQSVREMIKEIDSIIVSLH